MALPKQQTPIYSTIIPTMDKEIKFSPFLVKHEKCLLLAQQSEDDNTMVDTLKDVVKDCIKTDIDVDKLAIVDLEYLFSQIRAKSVGEIVELIFPCDVCDSQKATVKISFDLTKLKIDKHPDHNKKISLFDDVGIVMKYPSINILKKLKSNELSIDDLFLLIVDSIEYIYDSEEIYYTKEQTAEEVTQFINDLTQDQFNKIQQFYDTMPRLRQYVSYNCPVCGLAHNKVLEGIESFF